MVSEADSALSNASGTTGPSVLGKVSAHQGKSKRQRAVRMKEPVVLDAMIEPATCNANGANLESAWMPLDQVQKCAEAVSMKTATASKTYGLTH